LKERLKQEHADKQLSDTLLLGLQSWYEETPAPSKMWATLGARIRPRLSGNVSSMDG